MFRWGGRTAPSFGCCRPFRNRAKAFVGREPFEKPEDRAIWMAGQGCRVTDVGEAIGQYFSAFAELLSNSP
jgi:hypothetical protein